MSFFRRGLLLTLPCLAAQVNADWLENYVVCEKTWLEAAHGLNTEVSAIPLDSSGRLVEQNGKAISILPNRYKATHLVFDGKIYKLPKISDLSILEQQIVMLRLDDHRELRLKRKGFNFDEGFSVVSATEDKSVSSREIFRSHLIESVGDLRFNKEYSDVIPRLEKCRSRLSANEKFDAPILSAIDATIAELRRKPAPAFEWRDLFNWGPLPRTPAPRSEEDMKNLREWQYKHAIPDELTDTYLAPKDRYH